MLTRISDRTGVFAPQYYGSVPYYAALARYASAVIDCGMRYDKRFKSTHRCEIVDTRGPLTLTVPVTKPAGPLWADVRVSAHGQWWHDHRVSFESAYGRTPYFEFYIDRFMPWLRYSDVSIIEFDLGLDRVVRHTLGIETDVTYSTAGIGASDDHRGNCFDFIRTVPYYQVRADRLGFIGSLSILDLIFNMGPEAPLVLRAMAQR